MMLLLEYVPFFFKGILETLSIAGASLMLGLIVGVIFTLGIVSKYFWIHAITSLFCNMIRALPEVFVLFLFYFGGSALLTLVSKESSTVNAFVASMVALGLVFGSLASKIFYAALLSIPIGSKEAAHVLGLNGQQIWLYILFPPIFQKSLPGLGNLWLILLKDTAIVSLIGTTDLLSSTQLAISYTQEPFIFYSIVALIYLTLSFLSEMGLKKLKI